MVVLLGECHFWTIRSDVRINSSDAGAFRYMRQRDLQVAVAQDPLFTAKRTYSERRNGLAVLGNGSISAGRLKDNIKKLEELLRTHKVVHSRWRNDAQVLLLFANGVIAHLCIDIFTGGIRRMVFERYLVGKLASGLITDAFFTNSHIVLAYDTNQLTVVYLHKPNERLGPEKISNMDPKIFHAIIPGAAERKLVRRLTVNTKEDIFVVWTQSSQNEVYPWRPTLRDQDRANIHIFKIEGPQLESFAYCWTENDPLSVDFLHAVYGQLVTLEQKVSRKGEISAEICCYEIVPGKMQRSSLSSIATGAQISCFAFSPDQEKLFLGTTEHGLFLHDLVQQNTNCVTSLDIIATHSAWHNDSAVIVIASDRSQFQCFDLALSPVPIQLQSEDVTPLYLLDLSYFFSSHTTLLNMSFSGKPNLQNFSEPYAQTDAFLLFMHEGGPLGCLRFFGCAGMRGDIHNSGLTADVLVDKYLNIHQPDRAVKLLSCLNWETYGAMCLISLHKIGNYVFYCTELQPAQVEQMKKALSTFADTLSEETKDAFSDQVFDLKRRFFFFLLGREFFLEAFETAKDIEDYDLFMDLYNVTKFLAGMSDLSIAAYRQAAIHLSEDDQLSDNLSLPVESRNDSNCSMPSPSNLTSSLQSTLINYVPPLPHLRPFELDHVSGNISKTDLRVSAQTIFHNNGPNYRASPHILTKKIFDQRDDKVRFNDKAPASRLCAALEEETLPNWDNYLATNQNTTQKPVLQVIASQTQAAYQPKFYQHPLVSGHIPPTSAVCPDNTPQKCLLPKKPTTSILTNGAIANVAKIPTATLPKPLDRDELSVHNGKDVHYAKGFGGEKNKVKFSDTIQVAVVPEISRKDKLQPSKRSTCIRPKPRGLPNPKRELADSLPLCHPHDEYLKDFNPIAPSFEGHPAQRNDDSRKHEKYKSSSSIKVVHFGVV